MGSEITKRTNDKEIDNALALEPIKMPAELLEVQTYAAVFIKSGMFPDTQSLSQGIVKIMAGREMGLGPFESMRGIDIIQGQPVADSGVVASLIKRNPNYDYLVKTQTTKKCVIEFYAIKPAGKAKIGEYEFGEEDAKQAGLLGRENYRRHPKSMYFARAITGGARTHCPDVFGGPIYTQEELDANNEQDDEQVETPPALQLPADPVKTAAKESEGLEPVPIPSDTSEHVSLEDAEAEATALSNKLNFDIPKQMEVMERATGHPRIPNKPLEWQRLYYILLDESKKVNVESEENAED